MDLETVMRNRRSIRGFTDQPVSRDMMEEILAAANMAPSSMNTQPWHFHVLTGEVLENVRRGNSERMLGGVTPSREIMAHGKYEGVHRDRQVEIAKQWGLNVRTQSAGRIGSCVGFASLMRLCRLL